MIKTAKPIYSILILIAASVVSVMLAFGNYYYYQWLNRYLDLNNAFLSALLFSSYSMIIGGLVVLRSPRFFGLQIGESIKKWKLVLLVSFAVCAFTAICLVLTPRTPYSGANWAVEMILVPVSEEVMWRGVIFAYVYKFLSRLHHEKKAMILSVLFSSVAFGLAHISNMLVHPFSFVFLQMIFAAVAGSGMGYLRAKTESVYPPILLHALFNLIAIMF